MNWDEAHLQGDLEAMQHAREEAIVRAALERAADACEQIRQRQIMGPMPERACFDQEQSILALASNPAEVAAIIKKAGEDRG
jgi:hypothetical protein